MLIDLCKRRSTPKQKARQKRRDHNVCQEKVFPSRARQSRINHYESKKALEKTGNPPTEIEILFQADPWMTKSHGHETINQQHTAKRPAYRQPRSQGHKKECVGKVIQSIRYVGR